MSQTESNNIKACALPSSHLPLTREARTWCEARDSAKQTERSFKGKGDGACQRIVRMGSNPSGSRPNSFGRQHLTFDKGGKFSAGRGIIVLLQWL